MISLAKLPAVDTQLLQFDLRVTKTICRKLLSSKENEQVMLEPSKPVEVLILPGSEPTYFKMSLAGQAPPV